MCYLNMACGCADELHNFHLALMAIDFVISNSLMGIWSVVSTARLLSLVWYETHSRPIALVKVKASSAEPAEGCNSWPF